MPLVPALGKQRQADLCEIKALLFDSTVYLWSSKTAKTI